uniref:NADH-ubiquinone oxidoreductase chain 3 n=1 Tax=Scutigerella causeyae TaxID=388540 RepID=Q06RG0_9MYRI|nr:NADH dehydrogenase subunit 3 [Scutigerella causeyae]ABF93307.1 NADH dehydrogenase subunit 3 [Scutigerella causeyae]
MPIFTFNFFLSLFITLVLPIISYIIFKKSIMDNEKSSPFECGFNPKKSARSPFSLQFFLLGVLFLIFDIEITLILPMPLIFSILESWTTFILINSFILILTLGLFLEWHQGSLNWTS